MGSWKDVVLYPIPDFFSSLLTLSPFAVFCTVAFLSVNGGACFFLFNYLSYFVLGGLGALFVVTYVQMIFHKGICRFQSIPRLVILLGMLFGPVAANYLGLPCWEYIGPKKIHIFSWAVAQTIVVVVTVCFDVSEIVVWSFFKERQVNYGRWTADRLLKKCSTTDWFVKQEIREVNRRLIEEAELLRIQLDNPDPMVSPRDPYGVSLSPRTAVSPRSALASPDGLLVSPRQPTLLVPATGGPVRISPRGPVKITPRGPIQVVSGGPLSARTDRGDRGDGNLQNLITPRTEAAILYAPRAVYKNGQVYKPKPVLVGGPANGFYGEDIP
eukprot:Platyproteum_vivax@DN4653_c0_g1_i1.p1